MSMFKKLVTVSLLLLTVSLSSCVWTWSDTSKTFRSWSLSTKKSYTTTEDLVFLLFEKDKYDPIGLYRLIFGEDMSQYHYSYIIPLAMEDEALDTDKGDLKERIIIPKGSSLTMENIFANQKQNHYLWIDDDLYVLLGVEVSVEGNKSIDNALEQSNLSWDRQIEFIVKAEKQEDMLKQLDASSVYNLHIPYMTSKTSPLGLQIPLFSNEIKEWLMGDDIDFGVRSGTSYEQPKGSTLQL